MNKKIIIRWAKLIVLIYCLAGIAIYYLQDKFLFHPEKVASEEKFDFSKGPAGERIAAGISYEEINIRVDKGTRLNIVRFEAMRDTAAGPRFSKGVVLYFHGNKRNIARYAGYVSNFTTKGYEVLMPDYPGYGKSTGPLTEQKLYEQALVVYKLARSRYKPSEIIIYGKSLGAGIAAELAAVRDCRRLILETPAYSILSIARHWLPIYPMRAMLHYRFPTNEFLPQVTAPVTIFQGDEDGVVPYSNASRLKPLLKKGDEFVTLEKGSHNNLNDFPLFHQKLDSVLER